MRLLPPAVRSLVTVALSQRAKGGVVGMDSSEFR